jgi:hypothetical protein
MRWRVDSAECPLDLGTRQAVAMKIPARAWGNTKARLALV